MSNRCVNYPTPLTHFCHKDCKDQVGGAGAAFVSPAHRDEFVNVDLSRLATPDKAVNVERQKKYMPPSHDFACCAMMWRGIMLKRFGIDVPLDPETVGLMMVALKINRQAGVHDDDNLLDMKGYVNTVRAVRDSMKEEDHVQERSRIQKTLDRIDDKGIV